MHPPCSQPDWPSHVCPHALPPPHSPHTHTHTTHLAQVVLRLSQEDVVVAVRPNQRDLGAAGGGGGGCALRRLRTRAADPAAPQAAGPGAPPHLFGPLQGLHHLYRVHNPLDRHQLRLRLRTRAAAAGLAALGVAAQRGQRHGEGVHGRHDGVAAGWW